MNLKDHLMSFSNNTAVIYKDKEYTYSEVILLSDKLNNKLTSLGAIKNCKIAVDLNNGIDFLVAYITCAINHYCIIPINSTITESEKELILESSCPYILINNKGTAIFSSEHQLLDSYLICYTSGTTGKPKGICHDLDSLLQNVIDFNKLTNISQSTTMYHVLPMGYMAGFLNTILSPLMAGGKVVIGKQFSANSIIGFWDYALDNSCNTAWFTPTIISFATKITRSESIIARIEQCFDRIFVGTAPLLSSTKQLFEDKIKVPCVESYGMTEILLTCANINNKPSSVGQLIPNISIMRNTNTLKVKSKYLFKGYYKHGKITPPELEDGYFNTGDLFDQDSSGNLYIQGRQKDLIIKGGKNISAQRIEEYISSLITGAEVAAVGKPHSFWGEEVIVFITGSHKFSADDLINQCKNNLPEDHIPSEIFFVDSMPKNGIGKTNKNILKETLK